MLCKIGCEEICINNFWSNVIISAVFAVVVGSMVIYWMYGLNKEEQ